MCLLSIIVNADVPSTDSGWEGPKTIVLGSISDDPRRDSEGLRPLLNYVVSSMQDLGVISGEVVLARNASQMLSYMRQGKVDWVTDNVANALILKHRGDAGIVLRRWRLGEDNHQTTVFVRNDSPITSLPQLLGHTIAFQNRSSSSGFMVPAVELRRLSLPLALMASPRERPPAHMIGYLFSGGGVNTASWVNKQLVDAGALSSLDWQQTSLMPEAFRNDLRIIYRGEPLPTALEVVRPGMDQAISERLVEVLINAHDSDHGRDAIASYQGTVRYEQYHAEQWPYVESLWSDLADVLMDTH